MKNSFTSSRWRTLLPCSFILCALFAGIAQGAPLGTAFTYQGRLTDGSSPASGTYDMTFSLYDAAALGSLTGDPATNRAPTVVVSDGLFTVTLDFGSTAFAGSARWLQMAVRTNGSTASYTVLSPRQPLTPSPYALYAPSAGSAATATTATTANSVAANAVTGAGIQDSTLTSNKFASGQVVKSLNNLKDDVSLIPGTNVSITPSGNSLQISAGGLWSLTGNIAAAGEFLGTRNNVPLEFQVNNQRALRLEPNRVSPNIDGAPNVIGGSPVNCVDNRVVGATIGGGGAINYDGSAFTNRVTIDFGTVGGGAGNTSDGYGATVGGGVSNTASIWYATVGGGEGNTSRHRVATVGGGYFNTSSGYAATVGGGDRNTSSGSTATVGGGDRNTSSGSTATVGGGFLNTSSGSAATVPGGSGNTAAGHYSFAAGRQAKANHANAFVWNDAFDLIDFASTADNQFLIHASGGVGIGTESPVRNLDVRAGVGSERGSIHVGGIGANGDQKLINFGDGEYVSIGENGADDRMELTAKTFYFRTTNSAGGNVGIGTATPAERLDVNGRFAVIRGLGNEQAYLGGDGAGNDVQMGSLNSSVANVAFYNAANGAYMHVICKTITITGGADLAEPFEMSSKEIPEGAVVIIDRKNPGRLKMSDHAYDTHVAGIVSGAGGINPGIQLKQEGVLENGQNIALTGRVYALADASTGPIEPGDLLTTSSTPGHAMKVIDHSKSQGAILGKAMGALAEGKGMVLVLVTLQ